MTGPRWAGVALALGLAAGGPACGSGSVAVGGELPPGLDDVAAAGVDALLDGADDAAAPDVASEVSPGPPADADAEVSEAGYADWMSELLVEFADQDVRLLDITFPRAHDAGTYDLTWCSIGAEACNTQTQSLDMTAMLEAGVRNFDVRPQRFGDTYVTHHTTQCEGLGCNGATMQNIAAQTRAFLEAHAELVILELSHFCGTHAKDPGLVGLLQDELGDTLYVEPEPIDGAFIQRPLREVIPPEGGSGKVLLLWDGVSDTPANRAAGLFAHSFVPRAGGWSNKQHLEDLVEDQLARYAAFDHDGDALFEFSWTMTMDAELAVACLVEEGARTIESMAAECNGVLASNLDLLIAQGGIAKAMIPHVLSVDYADTFVTEQAVRLSRLNLE